MSVGQEGELFEEWLELRNGCLCCSVKYEINVQLERNDFSVSQLTFYSGLELILFHTFLSSYFRAFFAYVNQLLLYCCFSTSSNKINYRNQETSLGFLFI